MALIDALASRMEDIGVGAVATSIFLERMPPEPDTCVAIFDSGGGPPALTKGDDTDSPSFQVRARSLDAAVAIGKLTTVFESFHGLTETDVHGVHVKLLWALQSNPFPLGRDENNRFEFVMNYRAFVRGVTR